MLGVALGAREVHGAAGIHHTTEWRGCRMAACCACAAINAGDRIFECGLRSRLPGAFVCVSKRAGRKRLHRRAERYVQYRWAEGHNDGLPAMAADLVRSQVTVIAATSTPAALAAKAATSTIPIVFETGGDPINLGLVTSLSRPSGNVTGAASLAVEVMAAKGLELLHELIPAGRVVGLLVNPDNPAFAEPQEREVLRAASTLGLEVHVLNASAESEFDGVFAKLDKLRV